MCILPLYLDINECDSYNGGCDQTCINDVGSYHCLCEAGYSLDDNLKDCDGNFKTYTIIYYASNENEMFFIIDKDECIIDHDCTQMCNNIIGTYYCSCNEGYSLDTNDNKTCKGTLKVITAG